MVFLHIDKKSKNIDDLVKKLYKQVGNKNGKVFLLIFMEGCGPCEATRPEWSKLENVLSDDFLNRDDMGICSIDHELLENKNNLILAPSSFPTMRFITDGGKGVENYEDSSIENKDRTIDSFVDWIKNKTGEDNITKSEQKGGKTRRHKKTKRQETRRRRSRRFRKNIKRRKTRRY